MRREILICAVLSVITLFAFWPVGHLGFIIYDDHNYVTENPNVQAGITADSIRWAFTTKHSANWHPVTWLSHMLDCQLFGLNPGGHHWVNLGFHVANTLLLFIVLRTMTKTVWRSALVAALFALHPMRVESVAWISERKDVLSVFFAMLTLWAWTRYVRKAEGRRQKADVGNLISDFRPPTSGFYWLALGFFALGLMSKPMLVTLPVILLLLDYWPLQRISDFRFRISDFKNSPQLSNFNHLLFEKLPFAALSLASCAVTVWAQNRGGAVVSVTHLPWYWRIVNSQVFYTAYLEKLFWPVNLAVFYPFKQMEPWAVAGSALMPIALSVFCIRQVRSHPWLLVGWCWFVVMLLPVIGLVQVGMQATADRYTYLPSIGLFIAMTWGMADLASRSQLWRNGMVMGAMVLILACLLQTREQLHYWRNSVTLFSHVLEVTGENDFEGYFLLGNAYGESGDLDKAAESYRSALQINPDLTKAQAQLGRVLLMQKNFAKAENQFGEVLRLDYENVDAHTGLGYALAAQEKYVEAETEYAIALQLKPNNAAIREALMLTTRKAELQRTLASLYEMLRSQPTSETHARIAALLSAQGKFQDAAGHYLEALRLKPDAPEVMNNLAWLLATCPDAHIRDGAQASKYAESACELTNYRVTPMIGTLAAAYAEAGRFDEAIATAKKACALASAAGEQNLLKRNQELLVLYRAHQPYRETTSP